MLEVACFNAQSALVAQDAGADRIEFCNDFAVGGTTPAYDILVEVKKSLKIPVFVMIRPRGGDFFYSESEFEQMKQDIGKFSCLADGFVFGILKDLQGAATVDMRKCSDLVSLASPLPCTFHRAFDETKSLSNSLEEIIYCGFKTILTSGGAANAEVGIETLNSLVDQAQDRIVIMPGGGVRSSNIYRIKSTKATFFHTSAIIANDNVASLEEIQKLQEGLKG